MALADCLIPWTVRFRNLSCDRHVWTRPIRRVHFSIFIFSMIWYEAMRFLSWLRAFLENEDAPTMVEYGLLILLIAIAVAGGATVFGVTVSSLLQSGTDAF